MGRGRARSDAGTADVGAYEAGTFSVFNAWIWELLPDGATIPQHAGTADYDGDSANNLSEWLARTNPADPTSILRLITTGLSGSNLNFHFNSVLGRNYTLEYTTDFVTWIPAGTFAGTGSEIFNAIGPVSFPKEFIRLRVGL